MYKKIKLLSLGTLLVVFTLACTQQPTISFPSYLDRITFSIIRSKHDPIDIVLNRYNNDSFVLTGEKLTFAAGGRLKKRKKFEYKIPQHFYEEIEAALLDSALRVSAMTDSVTDIAGSTWYFSGKQNGFAFTCMWWSPTINTMERGLYDVVTLGMRILDMAELHIPTDEFY